MPHWILLFCLALLVASGQLLRAEHHNAEMPLDIGTRLELCVRWPRLVGQLGGLFKVDCHSCRQNLLG